MMNDMLNSLSLARVVAVGWLALLAGCGDAPVEQSVAPAGPVSLTPKTPAGEGAGAAYAGSLDSAELGKAIERFRVNKNRREARTEIAPADLDGDGRPEAVVLFNGEDWCSRTGCSLVVFKLSEFGYRPVSHIVNVSAPVRAGAAQGGGWRDLILRTGGGPAPVRDVRVSFNVSGYSPNALLQPDAGPEAASATRLIEAPPAAVAAQPDQPPPAAAR